jgi:hypothetical protein
MLMTSELRRFAVGFRSKQKWVNQIKWNENKTAMHSFLTLIIMFSINGRSIEYFQIENKAIKINVWYIGVPSPKTFFL